MIKKNKKFTNFDETIPLRKCEDCIHYKMIDSGYGYCLRFPPRIVAIRRHWRMLYRNEYPEVAWCENACGEFIQKTQ